MSFNVVPPRVPPRVASRRSAPPTPMTAGEKAIAERDHAYRMYRKNVWVEREKLFKASANGELLRKFMATIAHFNAENEHRMVAYVREQYQSWLRNAPDQHRDEALRMVSEQCIRNAVRRGRAPLNDPLPGQEDDTFRICKQELGL